jgi:hypothetical protein
MAAAEQPESEIGRITAALKRWARHALMLIVKMSIKVRHRAAICLIVSREAVRRRGSERIEKRRVERRCHSRSRNLKQLIIDISVCWRRQRRGKAINSIGAREKQRAAVSAWRKL